METQTKVNPKSLLPVVAVDEIMTRLNKPIIRKKVSISEVISDVFRADSDFKMHAAKHYNGATGSPDTPRQQRTILANDLRMHTIAEKRLDEVGVSRVLQSLDLWMAKRTGLIVFHGQLRVPAGIAEE